MDTSLQAQDAAAAKVAVAPRVALEHIESCVEREHYINVGDAVERKSIGGVRFPEDLLTICVLVLKNGFTVTGESACASPENFNRELGQQIARRNALEKVWMLEGYLLRERLFIDGRMA